MNGTKLEGSDHPNEDPNQIQEELDGIKDWRKKNYTDYDSKKGKILEINTNSCYELRYGRCAGTQGDMAGILVLWCGGHQGTGEMIWEGFQHPQVHPHRAKQAEGTSAHWNCAEHSIPTRRHRRRGASGLEFGIKFTTFQRVKFQTSLLKVNNF